MKKALLLSVVASTMIMAGGDIVPVEPVVEAPVVEASGWDFSGQAVFYYQTGDAGDVDLFEQDASKANFGLQLGAVNKDLVGGIGAGFELSGLGTLGLQDSIVSDVNQRADGSLNGAAWTQGYLTYGIANTSLKVGRQQLPKALSPFAFSEGWNVFKNTFEAALLVNSDISDTTLVYAYVTRSNGHGDLSNFTDINADGVHMVTVANKSVEGLGLTGTWYYAPDMAAHAGLTEDINVLWADAKFGGLGLNFGLQGGIVMGPDDVDLKDTTAFGIKVGGNWDIFGASVAYTSVDDGTVGIRNLGTGHKGKSPLYTQMVLNNVGNHITNDNDTVVVKGTAKALDGKFIAQYGMSSDNSAAANDYAEFDLIYKTKVGENTTLFAGWFFQDDDAKDDTANTLRFWGRYNF